MTTQHSFTKIENEMLPEFRKRINGAESTEDVKKFFAYTLRDMFKQLFSEHTWTIDDFSLEPDDAPPYAFTSSSDKERIVKECMETSDLNNILHRFAESAVNRFRRLEKNPDKTESKIRPKS